jgi:hypothetical protein
MRGRGGQLVVQHVERMARRILEEHPDVVREYVKGKRGVYALYRGPRLYYVGLASNLRSRLRAHLRDRHAAAWDCFSLYLTEGDEHLRELEALILRIAMPHGNRSKTKFARSQDLWRYFRRVIRASQRKELEDLFGASAPPPRRRGSRGAGQGEPSLAAFIKTRTPLRWKYKGRTYRATVRSDGSILFKGKVFNSPSLAASAVTHRAMNGWWSWRYEATPGRWVRIDELRKR